MPQLQHQHHHHHSPWKLEGAAPAAVLDLDTAVKDGILGGGATEKVVVVDLRKMIEELEAEAAAEEEEAEGEQQQQQQQQQQQKKKKKQQQQQQKQQQQQQQQQQQEQEEEEEEEEEGLGSVPAVFICPISLEPMVDPVTLCTGQTYERAHIARWLGMGHLTCPTTMQDLWDGGNLTPNRTLQHLIVSWFSARHLRQKKRSADVHGRASSLLSSLRGKLKSPARAHALSLLRRLSLAHPSLRSHPDLLPTVASLLGPLTPHAVGSEASLLLSLLLSPPITPISSSSTSSSSSSSPPAPAAAASASASAAAAVQLLLQPQRFAILVDLLGDGAPDTKLACARLVLALSQDPAFRPESAASLRLFAALLRLVRDRRRHPAAAAAALALIKSLSSSAAAAAAAAAAADDDDRSSNNNIPRVLSMLVTVGAVPTLLDIFDSAGDVGELLEPALGILDGLGSVAEGRSALKECPRTIPRIVRAVMLVSEPCTRAALNVLWAVCKLAPDECAPAAVEAGLPHRLLLVIGSGCAQELKQRASELLKLCSLTYSNTNTNFISKCKLTRTIQ